MRLEMENRKNGTDLFFGSTNVGKYICPFFSIDIRDNMKEQIISKVMEAGGRLTVKSALNPILWLCGIVTVPTLIAGSFYQQLPIWLIALACSPVAVALFGFLFLLFFDRDKLQSEEYQLRKRTLELTQQKDQPTPIAANLKAVVENPDFRSLPKQGENE